MYWREMRGEESRSLHKRGTFVLLLILLQNNLDAAVGYNWTASVSYLNQLRSRHRAPAVTINNNISMFAQEWADNMAEYDLWRHSPGYYGENIAMGYASSEEEFNSTDKNAFAVDAISRWYNEIDLYDFRKPGWTAITGHFTQVVWISTTEIGIGVSFSASTRKVFVVMNYNPPGNYPNAFSTNVLPEVKVMNLEDVKAPPSPPKQKKRKPPKPPKTSKKQPPAIRKRLYLKAYA